MTELKNFMDLLFDDQAFDDRKLQRRAARVDYPAPAAGNRSAQPYRLLRSAGAQLPGASGEKLAAPFPPGA